MMEEALAAEVSEVMIARSGLGAGCRAVCRSTPSDGVVVPAGQVQPIAEFGNKRHTLTKPNQNLRDEDPIRSFQSTAVRDQKEKSAIVSNTCPSPPSSTLRVLLLNGSHPPHPRNRPPPCLTTATSSTTTTVIMPASIPLDESRLFAYDPDTQMVTLLSRAYPIRNLLRLVLVVFGYLLIRPMFLKMATKLQEKEHERQEALSKKQAEEDARNGNDEDESDGEDDSWGAGIRRRRRAEAKALQRAREEAGELEKEIAGDKELEALLED